MIRKSMFTLALCAGVPLMSHAADISMFPKPQLGEQRHVIELPKKPNEQDLKVEILPGKTLQVDCNQHMLGGSTTRHEVDGWGYDYYRVSALSGPASTLMACPGASRHKAFVGAHNASTMLGYNSKLPLVVYAPNDVEIRYRVWQAKGWQQAKADAHAQPKAH